jgi:antitoxin component of MazEF toxin-antitoxin module
MYYMPVLRVRKVGNSLGVVFPRKYVAEKNLRPGDNVTLDLEKVQSFESTFGCLAYLGETVDEMNAATNEGEDL